MKRRIYTTLCMMIMFALTICGTNTRSTSVFAENNTIAEFSKSAVVMDYNSGEIIFEKNPEARLPVASMVKLMTILITCEEIENGRLALDTKIQTSENASRMGGSQVFIDPYVSYSCGDLLKSVIMASANDASVALAEHIGGSEISFVEKMNNRANQLGLKNTLYANCTGLPAPEQYSCAIDCAIILKNLASYKTYKDYSCIWMDELIHPSGRKTELVNTNKLIRYYNGCDCGKTGSTNEAGYCLSASAQKNDMRLISVVVGANSGQNRFKEVSTLFNYGFANFYNKQIIDKSLIIDTLEIPKAKNAFDVYAKEDFSALCKKGEENKYQTSINYFDKIEAPLKCGDTVGKITITKEGKVIKEIDIISNAEVLCISYADSIRKVVSNW